MKLLGGLLVVRCAFCAKLFGGSALAGEMVARAVENALNGFIDVEPVGFDLEVGDFFILRLALFEERLDGFPRV